MSKSQYDLEQFGVPLENIEAARRRQSVISAKRRPVNLRVPTRSDVLRLPSEDLKSLLVSWMEHSPVEIIPSQAQIQLVIEVLLTRPDAPTLAPLLAMCRNYANAT